MYKQIKRGETMSIRRKQFMKTLHYWLRGIRFYIAVASLLVTGFVIWWAFSLYGGTTLYPIRIEEIFAWLALSLMILAITIIPLYKVLPKLPGRAVWFDARRLIGVSAAWFATLHASIVYISLFKMANPIHLPSFYQRSFLVGASALLILLLMAFTSFNKAFQSMGIWWHRLHRFIYLAIGLTLLHAFMIGVHATNVPILITLCVISTLLILLYVRILFSNKGKTSSWQLIGVIAMTIFLAIVLIYGFQQHNHNQYLAGHKVSAS